MLRVALFQCNEVGKVVGREEEEQMKKELEFSGIHGPSDGSDL